MAMKNHPNQRYRDALDTLVELHGDAAQRALLRCPECGGAFRTKVISKPGMVSTLRKCRDCGHELRH